MQNSYVIFSGASELDGAPIVAIATGFSNSSSNRKTGPGLVQTWILRSDISPVQAMLTEADSSICGPCPMRGTVEDGRVRGRSCYVPVVRAPLAIWRSYARSTEMEIATRPQARHGTRSAGYEEVPEEEVAPLFGGRGVRIGAYGDPAAVPPRIWRAVTARAAFWTGYTHQWRTCDPAFARWCMASCETAADRLQAQALGYRTFRATPLDPRADRLQQEIVCPASSEGGRKTTCERCRVCGGTSARGRQTDVVIAMHGWFLGPRPRAQTERPRPSET